MGENIRITGSRALRMGLLALAISICLLGASKERADALGIVHPNGGSAYKTPPVDFRGSASLNVFLYIPAVDIFIYQMSTGKQYSYSFGCAPSNCVPHLANPSNRSLTGVGSDNLDIDGDWNVPMSAITNRRADIFDLSILPDHTGTPPLPDGTPLPDGKYLLDVIQLNHTASPNPNDSAHNRWLSTFWIDGKLPDTVIDTALPPTPTDGPTRTFTFHSADPVPSSGAILECRFDGSEWEHCDEGEFERGDVDRTGSYEVTGLGEGVHTFQVRTTDGAGNEDPTPATETWVVDRTPPVIAINEPTPGKRYVLGEHVTGNYDCEDPLSGDPGFASGIKTCSGPDAVDTSRLGNFEFTVTSEDFAGNQSSKTYSYAVDPPRLTDVVGADGPIAFYRLGDPLGATAMKDSSGNNRHGEYKNGIALKRPAAPNCQRRPHAPYVCDLTADPEDWSAFFPARDGYGFTNNIPAPQSAYTLEAWIKRADHGAGSIIGQGGAGQLFVNSEGRLALRQTQDTVTFPGPVLTPGEWFHVAATWDGHTTRLYVNGEQVGSSNSANKAPSGSSTLYVGYGEMAPWFHGQIDEAAYYGSALPGGAFATRYAIGTARDVPGPVDGPPVQRPEAHIETPANGGLYAPTKVPPLAFHCEDLDGDGTVASCTATVDGDPIANGAALPDTPGEHVVVVTAIDNTELTRSHTHRYHVTSFEEIFKADSPIAYYRLGDDAGSGVMVDASGNHRNGEYKNAQESGPVGIAGDGDLARKFHGSGGYGFTNNITAPTTQGTIEAWVNPDDTRDQSVAGHGDAGEIYIEGGVFKFRHMGTTVAAHLGPEPGRFTQVVAVWDGVTISLYVDGELHGQAEATRRPSSSSTFYVGYGEIKPWFKGSLDEVAYYGTALTSDRVLQHFLADPPPGSTEPGTSEPVDPVTDPGDDDPVTNPGDDDPVTGPGDGDAVLPRRGAAESAGKSLKSARAKKRAKARARAKCRKLGKAKKRKACLRRVNRR